MTQELFHTMNLKVAAALVTLGFEVNTPPITRIIREDGVESTLFWFSGTNREGMKAMDVANGMTKRGDELSKSDPENPINYMRVFASNRDEMIGLIKNTPRQIEVKKDGRKLLLSENASDEARLKAAKIF